MTKKINTITDIIRLITAVLAGMSAGLAVAKNTRELVRTIADDEGLLETLVHGRKIVREKGKA